MLMQATAKAHTNIALIKYWGKRDESLFLPMNGSLSLTLDRFYTTTTVAFQADLTADTLLLDGSLVDETGLRKVSAFLDKVRVLAGTNLRAKVTSFNQVPTAAGLASSASGFAALAAAASRALGLELDGAALSRLARQGSGSACRSIYGGFVEWVKGDREDGLDSHGVQVAPQDHWDMRMLVILLGREPKSVSSRDGMRRTVATSPFYAGWLATVNDDLNAARQAVGEREFLRLGEIMEANAFKMHATTMGANPPFLYWESTTLAVIRRLHELRASGLPGYFTADAGPNVKILCEPAHVEALRQALLEVPGVIDAIACSPGPGVSYPQEVIAP
jgi:diphosphomevalonate decarboxylase